MTLKIARSTEASGMLRQKDFRSRWARLHEECPWASAAQSPAFVTSWYEAYKDEYRPVLVCEFSTSNELIGFLPLALRGPEHAVLPGAHQAEYKSWLALPPNGSSFLEASLKLLSRETEIGALSFRYLPPTAPVERIGVSSGLPWICELESHWRPIVGLASGAEVAEYTRQKTSKTLKNSWNRLNRIGKVRLEQIKTSEELVPIFDRLIDWYEVRQEAAHGKRPFQTDKNKKTWHLGLLDEGLLHVTLLKVGDETISALFGLGDGKTYSVMMPMFAPEHARYSPMALHHLMLVERLHAEGYSILDLTPGPDPFKERFAGGYEAVKSLSIYFKQREWFKAKVQQQSKALTKGMLSVLGIAPSSASRIVQRIHALLTLKSPARPQSSPLIEPAQAKPASFKQEI